MHKSTKSTDKEKGEEKETKGKEKIEENKNNTKWIVAIKKY